jgi:hypothetical protein
MKIHALTTGAVRVKHSFLFPSPGARRQLDLFMPGPFSEPSHSRSATVRLGPSPGADR